MIHTIQPLLLKALFFNLQGCEMYKVDDHLGRRNFLKSGVAKLSILVSLVMIAKNWTGKGVPYSTNSLKVEGPLPPVPPPLIIHRILGEFEALISTFIRIRKVNLRQLFLLIKSRISKFYISKFQG